MRSSRAVKLGPSFSVKFVPRNDLIISAGKNVCSWAEFGRKRLATARPFSDPAYLDVSPNGQFVVVKSTAGMIAVLAVPTLSLAWHLRDAPASEGCQAYFSPCGEFIVDGTWQGDLGCRSVASGEVHFLERFEHSMVSSLSHNATRTKFLYVRQPKALGDATPALSIVAVRAWPFSSHGEEIVHGDWPHVLAAAISPDATRVAVLHHSGGEANLEVVELSSVRSVSRTSFPLGGTNHAVAWSPDGRVLACVQQGQVGFFEPATLSVVATHEDPYPCFVEFSPDGSVVALGSWEQGTVRTLQSLLASP
jgi:WD40 repeat protein